MARLRSLRKTAVRGAKSAASSRLVEQVAAVPFRRTSKGDLEFLLVSASSGRWIFPKGWLDAGRLPEDQAAVESFEEAGVKGRVLVPPVGTYINEGSRRSCCRVTVYLLEVAKELARWPEMAMRERCWATAEKAKAAFAGTPAGAVVEQALRQARQRTSQGGA
jgi:8-oxo-dGTP pyrophosphatase MutT (NUDIX family)